MFMYQGGYFVGVDALARRLKDVQSVAFTAAETSALGIGDILAAVDSFLLLHHRVCGP